MDRGFRGYENQHYGWNNYYTRKVIKAHVALRFALFMKHFSDDRLNNPFDNVTILNSSIKFHGVMVHSKQSL